MHTRAGIAIAALGIVAGAASAQLYQIDVIGTVDFGNLNNGQWVDVVPGDSAVMSFQVDANNFTDSLNFPTRGYEIISDSFAITLDGFTAGLANPYPAGRDPLFVIRNDDPAVDGFFLGSSVDGFPDGVATDESALLAPTFDALFQATYEGTRLDSLDIAGAVGTYDFTGLSVFNWGIEDDFVQPMGLIFDQWTITLVPAPASLAGLGMASLFATRRRRA